MYATKDYFGTVWPKIMSVPPDIMMPTQAREFKIATANLAQKLSTLSICVNLLINILY
jgi:hypothetical protein